MAHSATVTLSVNDLRLSTMPALQTLTLGNPMAKKDKFTAGLASIVIALAAWAVFSTTAAFGGQGAARMLYTVPNSTFIETPTGDASVVTINDTSGSIATVQTAINNARGANPGAIIVVHLTRGSTYLVSSAGLVLGSLECLVASGAEIEAVNSSVSVPLIQISSGSTNVSVAGGTLNGNGANINGIYGAGNNRVNVDKVIVQNCGLDCIQLNGNGDTTFDNELTVTRCDASGSPGHSGISIRNATQATCVDNNCHDNSVGIWLGNCAYANIANNTCENNSVGIDYNSGSDNYIANNTCNNNGTGILLAGSSAMVVSDSMGGNTVAAINSSGSGNIYADNVFTGGNATNFISGGSGDAVVAYQGPLNAPGQNYFYPPLINNQHATNIVNGMGRYDLTDNSITTLDTVQTEYNNAVSAHPGDVIVLHLNGAYTVGANPLTLSSYTCVLLGGTIQIKSSTTTTHAITATSGASYISISGGIIDGGATNPPSTGRNGIYFSGIGMFQIDSVTLQHFGNNGTRVGGSDVIQIDHGSTPRIITRCAINGGSARGIWVATSGVRDVVSDNTVTDVQMDGVDCDSSTTASLVKFNYLYNNTRYGVFVEQSASYNLLLGNICNSNASYNIGCYNNSATPRGSTEYNSIICNSLLGGNGLRNGSTGTNTVTTSHNFYFNNTLVNSKIVSQVYGTQDYYSQNYMSGGSITTSGAETFFNSPDVSGNVWVQDSNSGLEALVQNAATTNGAPVITGPVSGLGNDQWQLIPTDSGYYRLMNERSALAMAVQGASHNAGASIIQWTYNASGNDEWMPVPSGKGLYSFVNRLSGLDLDVTGASATPGTQLDQQPASGAANQQFSLPDMILSSFVVFATTPAVTVTAGNNTNDTVSVAPLGGFTNAVNLSLSGLPAGANGTFSTNSIYGGSGSATLTLSTLSSTAPGVYSLTLQGVSGTLTNTATTLLTINPAGNFAVVATPTSLFVLGGTASNATVSVSAIGGFSDTVNLSVSGLPTDTVASFNPASITGGAGSSTLTLTTSNTTPVGAYPLTITGTNNSLTNTATLSLVVMNIGLSVAPASQVVLIRSNASYVVTVATNSNFTGTATFGQIGLPANASASFNPASLNGAGASTLTVTASNSAAPGIYTLTVTATNDTLVASTAVSLTISNLQSASGTLIWTSASGVNTNWSTAQNWTNATAGGDGTPGNSNDVVFTNYATVATSGAIDNVVDGNTLVGSLTYNNTNGYHTTQIAPGVTLTISGSKGLLAGTESDLGSNALVYDAITGPGGTLSVTNASATVVVRQYTANGAPGAVEQQAVLDLSELDTFTDTGSSIGVGFWASTGVSRSAGTLYLARTNALNLQEQAKTGTTNAAIDVADTPQANSSQYSFLYLGQQNTIYVDGITVGGGRNIGWMGFNPAFANSSVYIRGTNGASSRVTGWAVGDNSGASSTGSNSRGTNDFTGGTIDARADTMILGRGESPGMSSGCSTGVVMFASGTIDVNNLQMGVQASGATGGATSGTIGTNFAGQMDVDGGGTLIVNSNLLMTSVNAGTVGGMSLTAILNINGGAVEATNIQGGSGSSTINLNAGTLNLRGGQITNMSAINIGAVGESDAAQLINAATIASPNVITIAANGTLAGNSILTSAGLVVNGAISPGTNGVGWMTNNGPVTLGAGGEYFVTVQDALAGPVAGWSFLKISGGGLNVQASSGSPFTIGLQPGGGSAANFSYGTNYDWPIAAASGVTNFDANKFAVDNSQFQNDLAGGYFFVGANPASAGLLLSFTNNHPPVALPVTYDWTGTTLTIPLTWLATNWSDPDGDPVALVSVNDSTNGGTVSTDGTNIYYSNTSTVPDAFTYVVQDVRTNPPAVYRPDDTVRTAVGAVTMLFSDFTLSAGPATQPTPAGGSPNYTVTVTPTNGFSGTVTLGVSGLPAGAGYSLNPTNISGSGMSTLTVTTTTNVALGSYPLTVTGASGSLVHTVQVTLGVAPSAPLLITLITVVGPNVILTGANGVPGWSYSVLASLNIKLNLNQWPVIATNSFDGNGDFTVTVPTASGTNQQYYLIRSP